MRLVNYLNEEKITTLEEARAATKRDCQPYIKVVKDFPLFRGYKTKYIDSMEMLTPRTDRRPTDMSISYHKYLDELFQKKFGWKVRSEGVFVTPRLYMAEHYARAYWFFPIGEFKYVWSRDIDDLYDVMNDERDTCEDMHHPVRDNRAAFTECIKSAMRAQVETYIDTGIEDIFDTKNEIAFKCDKYYLVNPAWVNSEFTGKRLRRRTMTYKDFLNE